ncbi:hypothetical protein [Rhizobium leguminosarum]|uniref:hypothetical protein n=1 Tax=Rhizobium leguminosarum TaxID=384 RepID=UPI00103E3E2B|nr:hypothetical protein [Rhizobium leguminosarum]TBY27431.1 hypothetical protein E0H55_27455 [Rhizobium leguminosarum bv. viciae]
MNSMANPCLNLDGVPSEAPRRDGRPYLLFDPQGAWRLSRGSRLYDIEDRCVRLHDAFKQAIMTGVDYSTLVYALPSFVSIAGHNSEAPVTRDLFERFLVGSASFPEINRFLYLADCQHLVSSIQECTKEVEQMLGEFYLTLNTESFFYPAMKQDDGVRYSSSPVTTKLFAFLGFIFVRMHSLLDYTVKVAVEAENLQTDFARYPKLSGSNLQYGDRKRVKFNGEPGTFFETCEFMTSVETLRNRIIHDGLLDDMPKAYEEIRDGKAVERYVLFPDMTEGRFDRFKNRGLFFGREDKINLRLPELLTEFQSRQIRTLEFVLQSLGVTPTAP